MRDIIMVVDDESDIVNFITGFLEDEGYAVAAFSDGFAALDYARLQPPALALVDLLMPLMNGRELIYRLRTEVGAHLPIILMSASTSLANARNLPIQDYISKPFDLAELLDRIEAHVGVAARMRVPGRPAL
ncbi:MAG TPA: response regulator transcription factor [Ktedonobacterales bacterium]|jgi:DNA-binding response OmpR family regulator